MKVLIAFAVLIAGISAIPQPEETVRIDDRRVTGTAGRVIEEARQTIRDAGLDPLHIKGESSSFTLPVPELFNYVAFVEDILSTGLSNIIIHRNSYSVITTMHNLDIEIPLVHFSVGAASAEGTLFGNKADFKASGKVEIHSIRIVSRIRINFGIISGINVRSVDITFSLGHIHSDVNLVIQGQDLSDEINYFVGATVPSTIRAYNNDINLLLEILVRDFINNSIL